MVEHEKGAYRIRKTSEHACITHASYLFACDQIYMRKANCCYARRPNMLYALSPTPHSLGQLFGLLINLLMAGYGTTPRCVTGSELNGGNL